MGDTRISLEYDGRGRLIRYDVTGYVTARCAYDEASNLILWTRDGLGDERLDFVYRATDGPHKLPIQETYDYLEDVTILTILYDQQGRLVVWTIESEGDPTSGERERYVFDAQGHLRASSGNTLTATSGLAAYGSRLSICERDGPDTSVHSARPKCWP
jgi:YD repeat-containing protein